MRGHKRSFEECVKLSNDIHSYKYKYFKDDFLNLTRKTKIKCLAHGIFYQSFKMHIHHQNGCPECGKKKCSNTKEFIIKANNKHNFKYMYSFVNYIDNNSKVIIVCQEHGKFLQSPMGHLNGNGCKYCKIFSSGELFIKNLLDKFLIHYIQEFRFSDCVNIKPLPFDFYLPKLNLCIEFDGKQHFKASTKFGEDAFKQTQLNDLIKEQYCSLNNIRLIRIDYKYNIKEIL